VPFNLLLREIVEEGWWYLYRRNAEAIGGIPPRGWWRPETDPPASTIYALFGLVAKFLKHIILTFDSLHPFLDGRDLGRIDESFHVVAKATI
jgi:hypothetical protein